MFICSEYNDGPIKRKFVKYFRITNSVISNKLYHGTKQEGSFVVLSLSSSTLVV